MVEIGKINSNQLYGLWKNLTVGLLAVAVTLVLSKFLPYYLSPVLALLMGSFMYMYMYNEKYATSKSCIVPSIGILYCIVIYSFVTIILNLMHIWGLFEMPKEFVFFTYPFIPSLILNPISFIVLLILFINKKRLKVCVDCRTKISYGGFRGPGAVLKYEAHLQLKNFIIMSGVLSLAVWAYYQFYYISTNINARDSYIFTWLTVIGIFIDWLYFSWRYYNLYLDLKENNEIITPSELQNMTAKTYVRYYVICGNYMYLTDQAHDPGSKKDLVDTPFFTRQTMNGLYGDDVKRMIEEMTGVQNGELRFFYGRKNSNGTNDSLLRFFYFLDGDISDYPELATAGEWVPFDKVKYLYSNYPNKMGEYALYDITRLVTIMLTEKIFDEEGYRKSGIRSYSPTFNLPEVRKSKIDFQDDKWIDISLFNSDTKMFKFKKWWRSLHRNSNKKIG